MRGLASLVLFSILFSFEVNPAYAQDPYKMRDQTVQVFSTDGSGSGVFISKDIILTANHVVGDQKTVMISSDGDIDGAGWRKKAEVIGRDVPLDLALIKVSEVQDLIPAKIDCAILKWGEPVVMVGFPLGITYVMSHGYVASIDLLHTDGDQVGLMLLDIMSNHGNSGGPVFNTKGDIVGILLAGFEMGKSNEPTPFGPGLMRTSNTFCNSELMKGKL